MNRRDFIKALGGGIAAGAAVPFLPIPAPPFEINPKAFAMAMAPLIDAIYERPMRHQMRPDMIYGLALHTPPLSHACRVEA